jgi:RimK family alpha-L-glutamate ligase
MNVVILSAREGWHTDALCRALVERGDTGRVLPYEALQARIRSGHDGGRLDAGTSALHDADAVLPRIIPSGSLEQIIFRVDALHWLERRGVRMVNSPRAIERCVDKFYTTALLHEAGIASPETVVCQEPDAAMTAIRDLLRVGEVIIKPLFGSMGHGMVRVADPETAFRVVRALDQIRSVYYLQRAIDHPGFDVRAFVVGGQVAGAIERRAGAGEWRTNVAQGGSVRPCALPPEWQALAVRAAAAVGAEYAGVDLMESRDGELFVIEVNAIPAWRGVERATGAGIARAIVEQLSAGAARLQPREAALGGVQ